MIYMIRGAKVTGFFIKKVAREHEKTKNTSMQLRGKSDLGKENVSCNLIFSFLTFFSIFSTFFLIFMSFSDVVRVLSKDIIFF